MSTKIRPQIVSITRKHYHHVEFIGRTMLSILVTAAVFMSCVHMSLALILP